MKKILLTLLALTLTFSACKNYDDEFAAASASIAELQAQVAGFSTLQAGLTALQASVASLQTTVNAIPTTAVDLSGLEGDLATSLANIAALQANLNTVIANYATSTNLDATQAAIDALNAALVTAQADLTELLSGNNVYDGNLTISNQAELDFAIALGNKVMIINGYLDVYNDLDAAKVNLVTSKIVSVTDWVWVGLDNTDSVDVSALVSVGSDYEVYYTDAMDDALTFVGGYVILDYDGGYVQPNLKTVGGYVELTDYVKSGAKPSAKPSTKPSAKKSRIASKTAKTQTRAPRNHATNTAAKTAVTNNIGTLTVDFSGLTSINNDSEYEDYGMYTMPDDGIYAVHFRSATSVKLGVGADWVDAQKALTVDLLAANHPYGLVIDAEADDSVITIAGRVDDGDLTSPTGQYLYVSGSATSVLNADNVSRVSGFDVFTIETALSFPALTKADWVYADKNVSLNAPLLVAASFLDAPAAKTVIIASTGSLSAGIVENLTFTALASTLNLTNHTAIKVLTVTGKAATVAANTNNDITLIGNTALTTVSLNGTISAAVLNGTDSASDKLTSVTTAGSINAFGLVNQGAITSISLGHSHIVGGEGSSLIVNNCNKLTSLTTSTDYLKTLEVSNNELLTTMNFDSYKNVIATGNINVIILRNKLSGGYTNAVAAGANPYVETVITSTSLVTLRPFFLAYKAARFATLPTTDADFFNSYLSLENVGTVANPITLYDAQDGDAAYNKSWNYFSGNPGYLNNNGNNIDEFLLIQ